MYHQKITLEIENLIIILNQQIILLDVFLKPFFFLLESDLKLSYSLLVEIFPVWVYLVLFAGLV
jgi:hypothetical protein